MKDLGLVEVEYDSGDAQDKKSKAKKKVSLGNDDDDEYFDDGEGNSADRVNASVFFFSYGFINQFRPSTSTGSQRSNTPWQTSRKKSLKAIAGKAC